MNLDRDSHFDPAFYNILIQDSTAPSHIGHRLAEIVGLRAAAFCEDTTGGQASVGGPAALGVLRRFQITKLNIFPFLAQFAYPRF
jgi:hypothetical protein